MKRLLALPILIFALALEAGAQPVPVGPNNVEMIVKLLDGTAINGHHWVYYGSLTNFEFTLTVTDNLKQSTKTYFNPLGQFASAGDVNAFPD